MSEAFVHESSFVDEGAIVGEGTKIWHFCHVMSGAEIGARCNVGQNVFVGSGVAIGDGCKIQNNVSLYTGVTLEEDVFLGPSMVFTNVRNPRSHVPRKDEYAPTLVSQGATVGANATIVCGVTLGRFCFVGAGAVVTRDVPDHALVVGVPAAHSGWMCQCGERLPESAPAGESDSAASSGGPERTFECSRCGAGYRESAGALEAVTPSQP